MSLHKPHLNPGARCTLCSTVYNDKPEICDKEINLANDDIYTGVFFFSKGSEVEHEKGQLE